jgi:cell division protease FtsH
MKEDLMKLFRLALMATAISVAMPQHTDCSGEKLYFELTCQAVGKEVAEYLVPIVIVTATFLVSTLILRKISTYMGPLGKTYKPGTIKENFSSIAGKESVKEELIDIIDYLQTPSKYEEIGTKIPRGILMHGPPGTGKTSLARAVAGEVSCSFIAITGPELNGKGVNNGAEHIKKLFKQARAHTPCIIFIDEIDSLGGDAQKQLLTEMDGFETKKELVIVIGSTNFVHQLTPALLRPGRFDRVIEVSLPNVVDRKRILAMYAGKVKMDILVELDTIAQMTSGFSGADLANLINEATIIALRAHKKYIDQNDLENAFNKIVLGKPEKTIPKTLEERRISAYHEAGHTLLTILLGDLCNPIHKVTIEAHENSGGFTATLPNSNMYNNKDRMRATITVTYGGLAAENLIFNTTMTGAAQDLQVAASIATSMIRTYGMSEKIGPMILPFRHEEFSEQTKEMVEKEIAAILIPSYETAYTMLSENRDKLDCIANALLEKDTLFAKDIYALLGMDQPPHINIGLDPQIRLEQRKPLEVAY